MDSEYASHPEPLIWRARSGDKAAFAQLVEMYHNYLLLFSRLQMDSRIQGKANPSDLVQETFLQAHQCFDQFRGTTEGELLRWLRRILVSRLAKLIRRFYGTRRRDLCLERTLNRDLDRSSRAAESLAAPGSSPSERATRREQSVVVCNALQSLPTDYRDVIIFRNFQELSFPEVAQRMKRSEGAVKKLWARALNALQHAIKDITHGDI